MTDPLASSVVLTLPGADSVAVRRLSYPAGGDARLGIDVYDPPGIAAGPRPAVLLINGYPDPGFRRVTGAAFKDSAAAVSWAKLLAAAGFVGVLYENADPRTDAGRALEFLAAQAEELGIDARRIALWACSGHVPTALWLLADRPATVRAVTLLYGYHMDLPGHDEVAAAARQFGFLPGPSSLEDLCRVPTLVLRAGQDDMPGLLASMDRFLAAALAAGVPLTLLNHPDGRHAFDLSDDRAESLILLRSVLDFLRRRLLD